MKLWIGGIVNLGLKEVNDLVNIITLFQVGHDSILLGPKHYGELRSRYEYLLEASHSTDGIYTAVKGNNGQRNHCTY